MSSSKKLINELGRRVTLTDLVEDNTETNKLIDKAGYKFPLWHKITYGARTGTRACLRIIGDLELIFVGMYAPSIDPEHAPEYILGGALGFATFYFLDYLLYDKINLFDPYKDFREPKEDAGE